MKESAIKRAARAAGGQSALARALGVTPQAVQGWCDSGKVPAIRVLDVERAIAGKVTRHELRSDLYPSELAVSYGDTAKAA